MRSTTTWFQNRRHPREELHRTRKKAWFIVKPFPGETAVPAQGPQPLDRYACQTTVMTLVERPGDAFAWEREPTSTEVAKSKRGGKTSRNTTKGKSGPKPPAARAAKAKAALIVKARSPRPRHARTMTSRTQVSTATTTSENNSGDSNASAGPSPRPSPEVEEGTTAAEAASAMSAAEASLRELAAYGLMDLTVLPPPVPLFSGELAFSQPVDDESSASSFGPIRGHVSPTYQPQATPYARVQKAARSEVSAGNEIPDVVLRAIALPAPGVMAQSAQDTIKPSYTLASSFNFAPFNTTHQTPSPCLPSLDPVLFRAPVHL